ncbi:uncharacterized protein LOC133530130 isoform X1 [Cydia pomonella]|uniref:uncharacterized protein LOC133530130 isoform X1 n=2 Tax=Cydia pomonella TaxID=82600 RepID=UPI002ADDE7C1|nr:uncharacterized protein LOC133530130 isoform X1 [Cydia pomonella]XP_061723957.1 uncharacterized protein LOC133530130 isoform X1 [Cydia pomonella]XP_061723958.1 uncharacterized protein LOC133530130 isoform X1 [Cydia pomonella]XP_061723959.1 uncharacterized protein LOC133530130 isoform X1 [Cydia pomonella]XP_061723960.1 uncharacterized protein LOC133530130 isoform X1 [Cydia pomonella]
MTSWSAELDEAAQLATKAGCWHTLLFYLLCALASIPTSFLIFSQVFTNATPEHWCAPSPEIESLALPDQLIKSLTVPEHNGVSESCRAYTVDPQTLFVVLNDYVDERTEIIREGGVMRKVTTRRLVPAEGETERKEQIAKVTDAILKLRKEPAPCTNGWKFSTSQYERTLVTEFALVCDNDWLPRTSNTLFWVGSIFGNLFFGWMSDRYGRRPTILLMIFLEVPLAISTSFITSYWGYTALRVAGGLFFPALYQQPFILALELMPPKKRTSAGIVVGMMFAAGMCLLALLAYAVRDWFYLSLLTSLPFVVLYGFFWITPESPRWLVGRGRVAEAEKVLINLAKRNSISLPKGFLLELHKKIKEQEDVEATMLSNANGHMIGFPLLTDKEEFNDRRISNMLTFKSNTKPPEETPKAESIERIIALEVAEIVNKRTRLKNSEAPEVTVDSSTDDVETFKIEEIPPKAHIETYTFPLTIRKKSVQLLNRMFKESPDSEENKKIDEQNSEGDCKASLLDIFRYPNIRKKFIFLTFNWVSLGVVYNGLSYNTPNLGVDDYLAFFIGGAVEVPSYFIAWRCMERLGRRWVLCVFSCIGGLACLCCVFVPEDWPWITVALAMVGRLCIGASFSVFYVQIGELLPTVLRAQAMGASSFIAGLGLLACPYIVHLAVYLRALPLMVLGILAVLAGIMSLFLPETLNQPLPQTLGDGELFGRNFRIFSCVDVKNNFREHGDFC